jgi:hypothetical protein
MAHSGPMVIPRPDSAAESDDDDRPTIYVAPIPQRWPPRHPSWGQMQTTIPGFDPDLPVVWPR